VKYKSSNIPLKKSKKGYSEIRAIALGIQICFRSYYGFLEGSFGSFITISSNKVSLTFSLSGVIAFSKLLELAGFTWSSFITV
jgi:hypothetical protein